MAHKALNKNGLIILIEDIGAARCFFAMLQVSSSNLDHPGRYPPAKIFRIVWMDWIVMSIHPTRGRPGFLGDRMVGRPAINLKSTAGSQIP